MSSLTGMSRGMGPTGASVGKTMAGYQQSQLQQFTPEQMDLFKRMFSQVSPDSHLSKLAAGDESTFSQIEEPALRQFAGLQGNIASRFSGMGSGARRSSGFQNVMGQQASDFAQQLQSQRLGLQRQALQDLMGMSESLLQQRPYEQFLVKPSQQRPVWQSLVAGGLPVAGAVAGGLSGLGPMGAAAGAGIGSSIASGLFGGESQGMDWSGIANLPTKWK